MNVLSSPPVHGSLNSFTANSLPLSFSNPLPLPHAPALGLAVRRRLSAHAVAPAVRRAADQEAAGLGPGLGDGDHHVAVLWQPLVSGVRNQPGGAERGFEAGGPQAHSPAVIEHLA